MNLLRLLIILLLSCNIAVAQISQQTIVDEITANLPTNNRNEISAELLRNTLNQMTSAIFQSQGLSGLTITNTATIGEVLVATSSTTANWQSINLGIITVSNSDGTLTVSPITGNVVASLNTTHPNNWTAIQNTILPLSMPVTDGSNHLTQNGSKTALSIYTLGAPAGTFIYGNVRSVIDSEPGLDIQNYNAYDAFIYNNNVWNSGSVPHAHAAVGLEIFGVNAVAGAATFGINPAFSDSPDGGSTSFASIMVGGELDYTVNNTGSTLTGFSLVVQGVQPAGANIIHALNNTSTSAQWTNGFIIDDGALKLGGAAILMGTEATASGSSRKSGSAFFKITDTGGTTHFLVLQGQPNSTNSQFSIADGYGGINNIAFVLTSTGSSVVGGSSAGSILTLQSTSNGAPSSDGVQIKVGGSNVFDCNITFANFCTVKASNGLALNGLNIIQVGSLASNSASGYELLSGNASSTLATLLPNKTATTSGIGAQAAGNVSIIASATEIIRASSTGPSFITVPTSAGAGGLFLCIDTAGVIYKKATCP